MGAVQRGWLRVQRVPMGPGQCGRRGKTRQCSRVQPSLRANLRGDELARATPRREEIDDNRHFFSLKRDFKRFRINLPNKKTLVNTQPLALPIAPAA